MVELGVERRGEVHSRGLDFFIDCNQEWVRVRFEVKMGVEVRVGVRVKVDVRYGSFLGLRSRSRSGLCRRCG